MLPPGYPTLITYQQTNIIMENDEKRREIETAIACGGIDRTVTHYDGTTEIVRVRVIRRTEEFSPFIELVRANKNSEVICTYTGKQDEWIDTITTDSQTELLEAILDLNLPLAARFIAFLSRTTGKMERAMAPVSDAAVPASDSESAARLAKLRNALDQRKSS